MGEILTTKLLRTLTIKNLDKMFLLKLEKPQRCGNIKDKENYLPPLYYSLGEPKIVQSTNQYSSSPPFSQTTQPLGVMACRPGEHSVGSLKLGCVPIVF
jgi:hypothetical protein